MKLIVSFVLMLFSACAIACGGDQLYRGKAPAHPADNNWNGAYHRDLRTTVACSDKAFVLLYSDYFGAPLWAAEHLTPERIRAARGMQRVNAFHEESPSRTTLRDYARSGWDRGHMAPSGDMPTMEAQHDSFSLLNMTPQHPEVNRRLWEQIESTVRDYVMQQGEVYVITLAVYTTPRNIGGDIVGHPRLHNGKLITRIEAKEPGLQPDTLGVSIPFALVKAIYDPRLNAWNGWVVRNRNSTSDQVLRGSEMGEAHLNGQTRYHRRDWVMAISPYMGHFFPGANNPGKLTLPPLSKGHFGG